MLKVRLAALVATLGLLVATPALATSPVALPVGQAGLSITIENEPTFRQGTPFAVSGYAYAVFALPIVVELSRGVPSQSIDILVDGARQSTVTTTNDGHYQTSFFLSEEQSSHTIQSVIFRGTPLEVRSALRTVNADQVYTELRVDPAQITLEPGQTAQIHATALDGDGRWRDVTDLATWSSDDPTAASVERGVVTAVRGNTTTMITATMGARSAVTSVTVNENGRG